MTPLNIIVSLSLLSTCVWGQDTAPAQPKAEEKKLYKTTRIIPIGARRTAKFKVSKKSYRIKMKGPGGEEIDDVIPAGVPIEIRGKENEYVPLGLYVKNKNSKTGEKLGKFSMGLNSLSPALKLTPRESITFYKRKLVTASDGSDEYQLATYARTPVQADATHLLVAIVKNIKEKEGWAKPYIKTMDASPNRFPADSCLFFNASPFPVSFIALGAAPKIIKPYKHVYLKGFKKDKFGAVPYRIIMKIGNKKERIADGALRNNGKKRHYIFTYIDPRKGVIRRGDLVTFSEKVPVLLPDSSKNKSN